MELPRPVSSLVVAVGLAAVSGCHEAIETPSLETEVESGFTTGPAADETGGSETGGESVSFDGVGAIGLRRLTRYEYDNTLRDILGDTTRPASQMLPEDAFTPFDNEYAEQEASAPLIEGIEAVARDVAERLVADPVRLAEVLGCTPAGTTDEACMRTFVGRFGRRALRRPLAPAEVDDFTALGLEYAEREAAFEAGVEVVVRALLQDAEMVYRVERGTPVEGEPGLYALDDFELATRLSYLLWGTAPSEALLNTAQAGKLHTPAQLQEMAASMLKDPRAQVQIDRFHAMWLGFVQLPHSAELTNAMRTETAALVRRVVFEEQLPWTTLFTASETFIDAVLAEHYGLPAPAGGAAWVPYGDSGRQGILSHGSFLSVVAGAGDTSPTRRGKWIREQLMCQTIPPPPPNVNVDLPPVEKAECKADRYEVHSTAGSCAGCHAQMDPIGFGLENYDHTGRYRAHDEGAPQCVIDGEGELVGLGTFNGPDELATLLVDNDVLEPCVAQQLYRFMIGRPIQADDRPLVLELGAALSEGDGRFDTMLLTLVGQPAFTHRREEV